ncbi:MAG TPA: peptidase E [Solirubrobacteraceae bacterium]
MSSTAPLAGEGEQRTILALGGGGFTMEPNNPLLDDYLLTLTPKREPKILFLATASGDQTAQINAFYARFAGGACVPAHLSLFDLRRIERPLQDIILGQDVIYAGGGSMRNLLALWRAHEVDRLLTRAWRQGIVLAGLSAGAMCWFQGAVTRSSGAPEPLEGLGLLHGSLTVHADGEPERLPVWLASVRDGRLPGGWAVDDGVGLLFRGECLQRLVSSRPGAGAQRVDAIEGELVRTRLEPELLGNGQRESLARLDEDIQELRDVNRLRQRIGQTARIRHP